MNEAALQHKNIYSAISEANRENLAIESILKSFYVDDFLGGGETVADVIQLKNDTENILTPRGFALRKYASNNPDVFQDKNALIEPFYFNEEDSMKVLGIGWQPSSDEFFFKTTPPNHYIHTDNRI